MEIVIEAVVVVEEVEVYSTTVYCFFSSVSRSGTKGGIVVHGQNFLDSVRTVISNDFH